MAVDIAVTKKGSKPIVFIEAGCQGRAARANRVSQAACQPEPNQVDGSHSLIRTSGSLKEASDGHVGQKKLPEAHLILVFILENSSKRWVAVDLSTAKQVFPLFPWMFHQLEIEVGPVWTFAVSTFKGPLLERAAGIFL